MDISEAVGQRRSVRAFRPDAVPRHILQEILELALRAPSWANTQPWEVAVVSGKKLQAIKQAFVSQRGVRATPDFANPGEFPEPFQSRFVNLAVGLSAAGDTGQGGSKQPAWYEQGPTLYGAPAAISICIDRALCFQAAGLNVWPIFDCGLLSENIMLLALRYGLGTIAQAQAVHYPGILRQALGLPETKLMLLGIAIGYPAMDNPVNRYRSERESADKVIKWFDSDESG
jgi:nitroreductase